jgi:hypothetical protein
MPALVAGIHVLKIVKFKDVDGRDKPGHDGVACCSSSLAPANGGRQTAPPVLARIHVLVRRGDHVGWGRILDQ